MRYIKSILAGLWAKAEMEKSLENRHPVLQWYKSVVEDQQANFVAGNVVQTFPFSGAAYCLYGLAYNLYLLAHNFILQSALIKRLQIKDQFHGAYYETFVAASFIKAGF